MKIGLIGEDKNDTDAIASLLKMKFNHQYVQLVKNRRGDGLENEKFTSLLIEGLEDNKPDVLIFIRDLDGFEYEEGKIKKRMDWFNENSKHFNGRSLLLLNIQELEAIFFADVESLNKIYKLKVKFKNPLSIIKPKESLIHITSERYHQNKAAELISKLNYDTVLKNYKPLEEIHNYFKE